MNFGVCEQYDSIYPTTSPCVLEEDGVFIKKGVCSEETEQKFKRIEKCLYDLRRHRPFIQMNVVVDLLFKMCNIETVLAFTYKFFDIEIRGDNNIIAKVPPYLSVEELPDGIFNSYTPYGKQEIGFQMSLMKLLKLIK